MPVCLIKGFFSGRKQNFQVWDYFPQVPEYQVCQMKLNLLCITEIFQLYSLLRNYYCGTMGQFYEARETESHRIKKKSSKLQANIVFQTDNASKTAQCSVTIYILLV